MYFHLHACEVTGICAFYDPWDSIRQTADVARECERVNKPESQRSLNARYFQQTVPAVPLFGRPLAAKEFRE
jgi:hypothetical protein